MKARKVKRKEHLGNAFSSLKFIVGIFRLAIPLSTY